MNTVHRHNGWIAATAFSAFAYPVTGSAAEDGRFEKLSVYLERNVQDHDAEVRFEVTGAEEGLAALKVSAPDERTVIEVRTPSSKLGIRSLMVELPEPTDNGVVLTIPEGFLRAGQAYTFAIGTVAKDGNRSFIEAGFNSARAR